MQRSKTAKTATYGCVEHCRVAGQLLPQTHLQKRVCILTDCPQELFVYLGEQLSLGRDATPHGGGVGAVANIEVQ
jgi:hypothetical protein